MPLDLDYEEIHVNTKWVWMLSGFVPSLSIYLFSIKGLVG